jgi:tetratricopeptide (TPR) repeat protein
MGGVQKQIGHGDHCVYIQSAGDVHVNDRACLPLIPAAVKISRSPKKHELDLLRAASRAVEHLVGRDEAMRDLWDWLHESRGVSIRAVTGPAGSGKSRLALELLLRLEKEEPGKWRAGFVKSEWLSEFAARQDLLSWGWKFPSLIVVDYAFESVSALARWFHELAFNKGVDGDVPLRILLVERVAEAGRGWYESLFGQGDDAPAVRTLFEPYAPMELRPLDPQTERRGVLEAMLKALADFKKRPAPALPPPGTNELFEAQLAQPRWGEPLSLMMAAMLFEEADAVTALQMGRADVALQLADHEGRRIAACAGGKKSEPMLKHLAAMASLAGGIPDEKLVPFVESELKTMSWSFDGGPRDLAQRLKEALPVDRGEQGEDGRRFGDGVGTIQPDILAEAFILHTFRREGYSAREQQGAVVRAARKLGRLVPFVVCRAIQDFSVDDAIKEPIEWLKSLVHAGKAKDIRLLLYVEVSLPDQTVSLSELAIEVEEHLEKRLRRAMGNSPSERQKAMLARLLNNHSNRLSVVGRSEEALEKAQEAESITRHLACARPETYRPALAMSLLTVAGRLSNNKRPKDALAKVEEAAKLYGDLAQERPDVFLPRHAASLNNLGHALNMLGRYEDALLKFEESGEIRQELVRKWPNRFLSDLAVSLNNQAFMLHKLGRHEVALRKAKEALRIQEQLARARPDAFGPRLVQFRGAMGSVLRGMGRHKEAAASFAQGLREITLFFQRLPAAFHGPCLLLLNDYQEEVKALGEEPDEELLAPIVKMMERMKSEKQSTERTPAQKPDTGEKSDEMVAS